MMGELTDHLWQSTVFAVAAGLLTVAFRRNRAGVRYGIWLAASFKFLVPFALLIGAGSQLGWRPAARRVAAPVALPAVSFTMSQIAQPFPGKVAPAPAGRANREWWAMAIPAVWVCGVAFLAVLRCRGWLRVRAAVRASMPLDLAAAVEVRLSHGLLEPGVVGLWRPVLLVPEGIADRLTPPQLAAVVAHELCHVRRHDNLFASVHMVIEAIFWFHPVVWWIGARLVEERERACDEEVLRTVGEPRVYADAILNVCRLYVESPLVCVSGVTGSNLNKRIEAIMRNRAVSKLSVTKKAALAMAGAAALAVPIGIGMMNPPAIRAQASTPRFQSISIQPCSDAAVPSGGRGGRSHMEVIRIEADARGKFQIPEGLPSGSLNLTCQSAMSLIEAAYILFEDGHFDASRVAPVEGGAAWVSANRYEIHAVTDGAYSRDRMMGPMLQALLEERFHLRIHRETRETLVYALRVAEGGLKLPRFPEGSCVPIDFTQFRDAIERVRRNGQAFEPTFQAGTKYCPNLGSSKGPLNVVEAQGTSIGEFSRIFLRELGRPVIDQTGLAGLFNFHLEYAPAAISTALEEQLGLRLVATSALRDFLVIDRVDMPGD